MQQYQVKSVRFSCVGLGNENNFLVACAYQLDEGLVHCDWLLGALVSKSELHHQPLMPVRLEDKSSLVGVGDPENEVNLVWSSMKFLNFLLVHLGGSGLVGISSSQLSNIHRNFTKDFNLNFGPTETDQFIVSFVRLHAQDQVVESSLLLGPGQVQGVKSAEINLFYKSCLQTTKFKIVSNI